MGERGSYRERGSEVDGLCGSVLGSISPALQWYGTSGVMPRDYAWRGLEMCVHWLLVALLLIVRAVRGS